MSTAAFEIKGWCPGALRPMQSGDGLLVRIRPHGGRLPVATLQSLAEAAARFGNGQIDLTRRANLQLRGVSEQTFMPLLDVLRALDLLDDSAESEAVRNIMVNPLAGLDPGEIVEAGPIARALERALATDQGLAALPGKFGFAIDGGGVLRLDRTGADIHLVACRDGAEARIAVGLATAAGIEWLGTAAPGEAAAVAVRTARAVLPYAPTGRARALSPQAVAAIRGDAGLREAPAVVADAGQTPRHGLIQLADDCWAVGLGAAFGRLDSETLAALARGLNELGVADIRLSPWRTVYAGLNDRTAAEALVAVGRSIGLIVADADPLVRIDACSGAGCCSATSLATRDHARTLAEIAAKVDFTGSVHVSGCAKGCARSLPADLVLVGDANLYRIIRHGGVKGVSSGILDPAGIATMGHDLFKNTRNVDV